MDGVLIVILVDVAIVALFTMVGFAVGKQSRTAELARKEIQIDQLQRRIERLIQMTDYLRAESEHFQARLHRFEDQFIAAAHLNTIPPATAPAEDLGMTPLPDIPEDVRLRMDKALAEQNRLRRVAQPSKLPDASAEALGLIIVKQKKET